MLFGCLALAGCGLTDAAHLLTDALRPAAEVQEGVTESTAQLGGEHVHLYRPTGPPEGDAPDDPPALVLVAGAVDDGHEDDRLVAFARAFARRGFLVATPDLRAMRQFRIDVGDPARIARVVLALPTKRPVSLAGISIGASYCLVAATRPEVRDRIAGVLDFGGYADLETLLRLWLTAPIPDAPGIFDPLGEGRHLVLNGNRDRLSPSLFEAAMASTRPLSRADADALLAPLKDDFVAMSPTRCGALPTAPIFILHGAEDPVVPAVDAERLLAFYKANGVPARMLVTHLFDHVEQKGSTPSLTKSLPLLRFTAAFLRAARHK